MRITYDNFGRVIEVKFDEGENPTEGFKFAENVIKDYNSKMLENNKYIADKNVEIVHLNCAMQFCNNQANANNAHVLKPCNVDNAPNKDIELTT